MARVTSQSPFTEPLNWNLYASSAGETYIPFHVYVQLEPTYQQDISFPQFVHLPRGLQLRIIGFCSSTTLFQLMHVSSATRDEARKLFWSDPGSRYIIFGEWLHAGGFPSETLDAVTALACMKHVEVDFRARGVFPDNAWGEDRWPRQPTAAPAEQLADAFWQTFQRCLPGATSVVLKVMNYIPAREAAPASLTMLAERCPARIRASTSCLQSVAGHRFEKRLWQQVGRDRGRTATWKLADSPSDNTKCVLPPIKTFRGPVGAYCRWKHHRNRLGYLHNAETLLRIQVIEAYYTQNPQVTFVCPVQLCNFRFKTPREWALHASEVNYASRALKPPSNALEVLFSKHSTRLAHMKQGTDDEMTGMRLEWGEEDSEQRRKAEEGFLYQLENDPDYAHEKPPQQTKVWYWYWIQMSTKERKSTIKTCI